MPFRATPVRGGEDFLCRHVGHEVRTVCAGHLGGQPLRGAWRQSHCEIRARPLKPQSVEGAGVEHLRAFPQRRKMIPPGLHGIVAVEPHRDRDGIPQPGQIGRAEQTFSPLGCRGAHNGPSDLIRGQQGQDLSLDRGRVEAGQPVRIKTAHQAGMGIPARTITAGRCSSQALTPSTSHGATEPTNLSCANSALARRATVSV